jgi:hypothetical protein
MLVAASLALTACASMRSAPDVQLAGMAIDGARSSASNVLAAQEIGRTGERSAWAVVERLRPGFIVVATAWSGGGRSTFYMDSARVVYVDGARAGGLEQLRWIRAEAVQQIERLDGPAATTRFGADHAAGALMVTTRR